MGIFSQVRDIKIIDQSWAMELLGGHEMLVFDLIETIPKLKILDADEEFYEFVEAWYALIEVIKEACE